MGRTPSAEEQQQEAQRRANEQARWSNAAQWFSDFYTKQQKVSGLYWERVEGLESDLEKADQAERQAMRAQAFIGQNKEATYRANDGLYRATIESGYHSRETNRNIFIELKDGCARPRPPLRESEFASHQSLYMEKFNAAYGQILDFMAVKCGYSSVEIDLPDMSPVISQYDYMRLNALMALAKERGLGLSFGPKVMEALKDRPNDYQRYINLLQEVNAGSKLNSNSDGLRQYEYQRAIASLNDKPRSTALNYGKELKDSMAAGGQNIEKLNAYEKALNEVDGRLKSLEQTVNAMNHHIDDYVTKIGEARTEDDLKVVERYIANAEKQRVDLMAAVKVEREDLRGKRQVLTEMYDVTVKDLVVDKAADGTPLKDEAKAAQDKRRAGMKDVLQGLGAGINDRLTDDKLAKIQTDRINELKTKVDEKKKALAASKPGGP